MNTGGYYTRAGAPWHELALDPAEDDRTRNAAAAIASELDALAAAADRAAQPCTCRDCTTVPTSTTDPERS